jgi:hypothetical protein
MKLLPTNLQSFCSSSSTDQGSYIIFGNFDLFLVRKLAAFLGKQLVVFMYCCFLSPIRQHCCYCLNYKHHNTSNLATQWSDLSNKITFLLSRVTRLGEFLPIGQLCQFSENYRSSANSRAAFFHNTSYVLILTKKWWGYFLATFFTNSSGHPAADPPLLFFGKTLAILTHVFREQNGNVSFPLKVSLFCKKKLFRYPSYARHQWNRHLRTTSTKIVLCRYIDWSSCSL